MEQVTVVTLRTCAAIAAALFVVSSSGRAQGGSVSAQCPSGTVSQLATQDACQKAIDLFRFMGPQLGVAIVGGNAVLGEPGATRGLGHFSLGLRVNTVRAILPRIEDVTPSVTGARASDYETREQAVPVPVVDVAIGLFKGIPFAGTYALAVDALVNLAYLPELNENDIQVTIPDGSVKLGFGGRVALLQETFLTPAVTVSYLRRDLPVVDVLALVGNDELAVRKVNVKTSALRAVVGKTFTLLGLAAGYGIDKYDNSALVSVRVNRDPLSFNAGPIDIAQDFSRRNLFIDASLNFSLLRIAAEVGRVSGGSIETYNTFGERRADDAMSYASLGLRFAW